MKERFFCKECGGKGICEHGKRRKDCRHCGKGYCSHGKLRRRCLDCGGKGICEHNRVRYRCFQCRKCAHGVLAVDCPACVSVKQTAKLCVHGLVKRTCGDCKTHTHTHTGGCNDNVCLHDVFVGECELCWGGLCVHSKLSTQCDTCRTEIDGIVTQIHSNSHSQNPNTHPHTHTHTHTHVINEITAATNTNAMSHRDTHTHTHTHTMGETDRTLQEGMHTPHMSSDIPHMIDHTMRSSFNACSLTSVHPHTHTVHINTHTQFDTQTPPHEHRWWQLVIPDTGSHGMS
eukprot:GHVR01107945.1.p1 GENE.GHVR01107945.1~~GHVR01107945.1.p1  ORF type:complete len:287 (+),score=127.24 GHVR01107945.1:672-1532(+)